MKVYTTRSGSVYYVDEENKRIRREGREWTTERASVVWRQYISVYEMHKNLLIMWDKPTTPLLPGSPDASWPSTLTTQIVSMREEP